MEFHGLSTGFGGYKFRLERFFYRTASLQERVCKSLYADNSTVARALWEYSYSLPLSGCYAAPVFSYYETIVSELNDPKLFLLRLDEGLYNRTTDLGAAWHPGYSGHRKMAMWIIPYISTSWGGNWLIKLLSKTEKRTKR